MNHEALDLALMLNIFDALDGKSGRGTSMKSKVAETPVRPSMPILNGQSFADWRLHYRGDLDGYYSEISPYTTTGMGYDEWCLEQYRYQKVYDGVPV